MIEPVAMVVIAATVVVARRVTVTASDEVVAKRGASDVRVAERPPRPPLEAKPKPKRLRPGRAHRQAVLSELPEEHKPIAEQVLRGGIPAVRQAIDKQNEENRAAGQPEINAAPLIAIAEDLSPRLRSAEWQDRAEAALADIDELDLRDLRSVVVAADGAAKDEASRAQADELRAALVAAGRGRARGLARRTRHLVARRPGGPCPASQLATAEGGRAVPCGAERAASPKPRRPR